MSKPVSFFAITNPILWLLLFAVGTPLMLLIPAIVTTEVAVQSTKIPVAQLAELLIPLFVIGTLFAGVVASHLHNQVVTITRLGLLAVSFTALGMFATGQGIHFSAQTLNHFVITNSIFGELRSVAYLFNEKLTHLIWLPPVLSFPTILLGWGLVSPKQTVSKISFGIASILSLFAGGWYGLVTGLAVLEAQLAKQAIPWLIGLLISSILFSLFGKKFRSPHSILNTISLATMLAIIVLWRLKFNGFPEPIDVFGLK